MALTKVRGAGIDADGQEIILDADQDTTVSVDTDDQVDIKIGGTDRAVFLANNMHLIGGNVARIQLSSSGTGTTPNTGNNNVHIEGNDDTLVLNAAGNGIIKFQENGEEHLRLTHSVTGSGFTANSGTSVISHPIHAIRASGQSRTDSYYDFTVDLNGGLYIICGFSHDQSPLTYGEFANFQVGHNATYITVNTLNAYGGNGSIGISKTSNTNLRVTFNKDESSGSGSYGTIEFVAVFGANPF